jgi:hypothetical protein
MLDPSRPAAQPTHRSHAACHVLIQELSDFCKPGRLMRIRQSSLLFSKQAKGGFQGERAPFA